MSVTGDEALRRASTAVARSVKAGDLDAERSARAELAMVGWRRQFAELAALGVRLSDGQVAEVCGLLASIGPAGPVRVHFGGRGE